MSITRHRRWLAFLAAVVSLAVAGSVATPAQASTRTSKPIKVSYRYDTARSYKSSLGCISVRLTGRIGATKTSYVSTTGHFVWVTKNPRLTSPRMTATVRKCKAGSPRRVKRATLTQSWIYNQCSLKPSFSVSAPFSVGASISPRCSKRKAASNTTTYGRGAAFGQENPGLVAKWKKKFDSTDYSTKGLCLRPTAKVTIYKRNRSVTKSFTMSRVCT